MSEKSKAWIMIKGPLFPPLPSTTTILAIGVLGGVLAFTPMIAVIGKYIPMEFRDDVTENLKLMRDAMLLVLGYYFSKVVNAGEQSMATKAIEAARESQPTRGPIPTDVQSAADAVADAATEQANEFKDTQR